MISSPARYCRPYEHCNDARQDLIHKTTWANADIKNHANKSNQMNALHTELKYWKLKFRSQLVSKKPLRWILYSSYMYGETSYSFIFEKKKKKFRVKFKGIRVIEKLSLSCNRHKREFLIISGPDHMGSFIWQPKIKKILFFNFWSYWI